MDGLDQHMQNYSDEYHGSHLQIMLKQEEYDTDALNLDVADDGNSNLSLVINDKLIFNLIKQYVYDTKCMLYHI